MLTQRLPWLALKILLVSFPKYSYKRLGRTTASLPPSLATQLLRLTAVASVAPSVLAVCYKRGSAERIQNKKQQIHHRQGRWLLLVELQVPKINSA